MTLTQTAILVKQAIVISVAALVLTIVGFIGYKIWYAYYLANLPPVEEKPDLKFGLLPKPDFPTKNVSTSNFSYSLDTTTGGLPKIGADPGFEKIIKVYFVTQTFATFLSPDRSQSLAEKFGIFTPPEILSETRHKFQNQSKSLVVDLNNGNFAFTNEATNSGKVNFEDNELITSFKQILTNLGVFKDTLKESRNKIIFLKNTGSSFTPTEVRAEAGAVQISIWPTAENKKPIFTADFNKSIINATVVGNSNNLENYQSLNFTYYPIDASTYSTYPVKATEAAFEDLKGGKGVVITEPLSPKVAITSVSLGYYLSENYSPYLQPIFVFEGPSFVAYVSAISDELQSPSKQN